MHFDDHDYDHGRENSQQLLKLGCLDISRSSSRIV